MRSASIPSNRVNAAIPPNIPNHSAYTVSPEREYTLAALAKTAVFASPIAVIRELKSVRCVHLQFIVPFVTVGVHPSLDHDDVFVDQ
jgi:hypothetical protein